MKMSSWINKLCEKEWEKIVLTAVFDNSPSPVDGKTSSPRIKLEEKNLTPFFTFFVKISSSLLFFFHSSLHFHAALSTSIKNGCVFSMRFQNKSKYKTDMNTNIQCNNNNILDG